MPFGKLCCQQSWHIALDEVNNGCSGEVTVATASPVGVRRLWARLCTEQLEISTPALAPARPAAWPVTLSEWRG